MVFVAFLGASSVGLASGCSTSDKIAEEFNKAQYVALINSIVVEIKQEAREFRRLIQSGSLADAGPVLKQAAARFDRIVTRLQQIDPPAAIKAVHDRFTATLVQFRAAVAAAKTAFQNGDFGALVAGGQELLGFPQRLETVISDYNQQGYAVR